MKKSPLLLAAFIIFLASSALSISYYADVNLDVSPSGQVKISGSTNHPMLAAGEYESYTSKSGSTWLLNISINDSFSDYIYSAKLPQYSSVNYIKSSSPVRIEENSQRITIIGTGKSQPLSIIIQYEIKYKINLWKKSVNLAAPLILLAALGALIYFLAAKKSKAASPPKKHYNESALTERQKQIVRLIEKKGGSSTQNVLEKELSIPKASLSRNLETLSKKGIIKKESRGMSNIVYFPKADEKREIEENNSDKAKKTIKYWN
jgi:uncharacterized membrane protein